MKRRSVHLVFGVLCLCCAGAALERGLRLRQTTSLNAEIARIATAPVAEDAAPLPQGKPRELRLAQALALSRSGHHEAALKAYAGLIQNGERDAVAQEALFNLANMYLRQGLAQEAGAVPLYELGKQRLRDLLHVAPEDWDARYNLERALRLAPEVQEVFSAEQQQSVEERKVRIPGFVDGDLP